MDGSIACGSMNGMHDSMKVFYLAYSSTGTHMYLLWPIMSRLSSPTPDLNQAQSL